MLNLFGAELCKIKKHGSFSFDSSLSVRAPPTQTCCAWSGANTRHVKGNTILLIEFGLQVRNEQRSDLKRCACCHWCMIWLFSVRIRLTSVLLAISGAFSIWNWDGWDVSLLSQARWVMCMRFTLCAKGPGFIFCLFHACMIAHNNALSYILYMCIIYKHLKLYSSIQQDALLYVWVCRFQRLFWLLSWLAVRLVVLQAFNLSQVMVSFH